MKSPGWVTSNTKEAASLNALGFPILSIEVVENVVDNAFTGPATVTLSVGGENVYHKGLALKDVINPWKAGTLAIQNPMHPFLLGLRACNAYDRMLQWMHGRRLRLVPMDGGLWYQHADGEEPASFHALDDFTTRDLRLVCALTVLGFPVLSLEGRTFRLPRYGHRIKAYQSGSQPVWLTPDILTLTRRAEDGRNLAIEATEPAHSILTLYNAGELHRQLLCAVKDKARNRTLSISPSEYTGKSAIISENATTRVQEQIQAFFGLPV